MNCPHCGKLIPRKTNGHSAYQEDIAKADKALTTLARAMGNPDALLVKSYSGYPIKVNKEAFKSACAAEILRLIDAIKHPAKLYAIYRRGDRKTPVGYGLGGT